MFDHISEKGTLFLVTGCSGAGKSTIIEGARRRLAREGQVVFPMRTINRPGGSNGELHVAVTPAQFDRLRRLGAFSLCWGAKGVNYALPSSIDCDLACGRKVVVNIAPSALQEARARYPGAVVVWISAAPADCRRRLETRGTDSPAEIEHQLSSAEEVPTEDDVEVLANDGNIDDAVDAFLALLSERRGLSVANRPEIPAIPRENRL